MTALGPGIGEEDVGDGDAAGREEIADGVAEFEAKDAEVGLLRAGGALFDFADAAEEAFDGEEIYFGMLGGVGESETAVTGAEVEFDGAVVAEDGGPVEALAEVGDLEAVLGGGHGLFIGSLIWR